MTSNTFQFILGLIIAAVPFSGIPALGETILLTIIGLLLIGMSVLQYIRGTSRGTSDREEASTYVENTHASQHDQQVS